MNFSVCLSFSLSLSLSLSFSLSLSLYLSLSLSLFFPFVLEIQYTRNTDQESCRRWSSYRHENFVTPSYLNQEQKNDFILNLMTSFGDGVSYDIDEMSLRYETIISLTMILLICFSSKVCFFLTTGLANM